MAVGGVIDTGMLLVSDAAQLVDATIAALSLRREMSQPFRAELSS